MNTTSIINVLKQERNRIDAAIAALSRGTVANGRRHRGRNARIGGAPAARRSSRRKLSATARKRISDAAKARWAKAKRAGRNSL